LFRLDEGCTGQQEPRRDSQDVVARQRATAAMKPFAIVLLRQRPGRGSDRYRPISAGPRFRS
jgi:hypothetical protein